MLVKVDTVNSTEGYYIYGDREDWDTCESVGQVYKAALREYGRCVSKMYIDKPDGKARHIGWVFHKRQKYDDCNKTFLLETWISPLTRRSKK